MRLVVGCEDGHCPRVFEEDGGDLVVQGTTVKRDRLGVLPADESAVRVPRALLLECAARLREEG